MKHSAVLARGVSLPFGGNRRTQHGQRPMPCQKEENERSEVKSTKTIRMSLFAGCRLFSFRYKRECGGCVSFPPRNAANDSGPMPEP